MAGEYVTATDDGFYYLAGTRVPLAAVVYPFREGESPESIRQSYPVLSLEQVYGAITFCLAHVQQVNRYLARLRRHDLAARRSTPPLPPSLKRHLTGARAKSRRRAATA